jgi:hypothetical protein
MVRSATVTPVPGNANANANAATSSGGEAAAYVLRLCLDLQLDAMLLTLGAAVAGPATGGRGGRSTDPQVPAVPEGPVWRTWLDEDLDCIRGLAADVLAGGATLPASLGSELQLHSPGMLLSHLSARYEGICSLLDDLVAGGVASGELGASLDVTVAHCRRRLAELTAFRPGTAARHLGDHEFLPGELLG